jgi:hypothetical protein
VKSDAFPLVLSFFYFSEYFFISLSAVAFNASQPCPLMLLSLLILYIIG